MTNVDDGAKKTRYNIGRHGFALNGNTHNLQIIASVMTDATSCSEFGKINLSVHTVQTVSNYAWVWQCLILSFT